MLMNLDVFISHSSEDKEAYIYPLTTSFKQHGITYWLDSENIGWGDQVLVKINEGMSKSRYVLLCLSKSFIKKNWAAEELNAVLSKQTSDGNLLALPLILDSKREVIDKYPFLEGRLYKEYASLGPDGVARDLLPLLGKTADVQTTDDSSSYSLCVHSMKLGRTFEINVSIDSSLYDVTTYAADALGLKEDVKIDVGRSVIFRASVNWVLVSRSALDFYGALSETEQRRISALVDVSGEPKIISNPFSTLRELAVEPGHIFVLCMRIDPPRLPRVYSSH